MDYYGTRVPWWDGPVLLGALLIVLGLELLGCFGTHRMTISYLVFHYIPRGPRAMILGWLVYHFLIERPY